MSSTTEKTVHILVSGRVQGVWYRGSTQKQAQQRQLRGWVRNLDDGSVEALVSGSADKVDDLVAWMRQGPAGARVDDLQIINTSVAHADLPDGFEVRR